MPQALIHELATARFVGQREDAPLLGPPGTGKSHLAQALGRAAILQGYRVIYREAQSCSRRSPRPASSSTQQSHRSRAGTMVT